MEFVRGDTFAAKVLVTTKDNKPIKLIDVDTIYITCRKYPYKDSEILFQKTIDDITIDECGYIHFVFEPSDTEKLDYDTYYFDIEITLTSGYRKSAFYNFELTSEATFHPEVNFNGN